MATLEQIYKAVIQLQSDLGSAIASAKLNPKQITIVQGLSEISKSLGSISAGEFLALKSGYDPQDADGIGTFISAVGRIFGTNTYHIGGVYNGDLKWGANAETGELEAGDGAVKLTAKGLSIYNGATEVARLGNLNGFLSYATDTYGFAIGTSTSYMTYDPTEGLKVYGAKVSDREILTADRTYYVRTDGNDSNNGLTNTAGGAFLTLQHAIDVAADSIDSRGYDVTIQLADGTYTTTTVIRPRSLLGTGQINIYGNLTTPSNVVIQQTTASTRLFEFDHVKTTHNLKGFKLISTNNSIVVQHYSHVTVEKLDFGLCGLAQLVAYWGGEIEIVGPYTISGNATFHFRALENGKIFYDGTGVTITLTGTPTFGTFAAAGILSEVYVPYITWNGSATGQRYTVNYNSIMGTNGAGANYFPGSTIGTVETGGYYN